MTPTNRCLGLVNELYAEAAEFLEPAAEYAVRQTDCRADTATGTHEDGDADDTESGGERVPAH